MDRNRNFVALAVGTALAAHIVLTALDNLPDTKVSLGTLFPWLRKIPQWRFFAPNPGIEDLYVMYRWDVNDEWSKWTELVFGNRHRFYSAVWNPGSRAPKALFDTAHQLRTLAGFGSSFEWALGSDGYSLVSEVVRDRCAAEGASNSFQFMILAVAPSDGDDGLKPILVSPPTSVITIEEAKATWI